MLEHIDRLRRVHEADRAHGIGVRLPLRARRQAPRRSHRMGVVLALSGTQADCRCANGGDLPAPPPRDGAPTRRETGAHAERASASASPLTPSGTRSRRTCSRAAPTSAPSRSCSATAISRPTMIYTHVLETGPLGVTSPADRCGGCSIESKLAASQRPHSDPIVLSGRQLRRSLSGQRPRLGCEPGSCDPCPPPLPHYPAKSRSLTTRAQTQETSSSEDFDHFSHYNRLQPPAAFRLGGPQSINS
jgi:hypothetical protein